MLLFILAVLVIVVLGVASEKGLIDGYNAIGIIICGMAFGGLAWLVIDVWQFSNGVM